MNIFIASFCCGPVDTNAYVIACTKTRQCVIVDPAPGSFPKLSACIAEQAFLPQTIWLTHSHLDHIGDCAALKKFYQIPLSVHRLDAPNVENPGVDGLGRFFPVPPCTVDSFLEDGQNLSIGDLSAKVIHTPGHCRGAVCFYFENEEILISGDTLFAGSIGRIDLPTAEAEKMWKSLALLAKLPQATRFFPGHGPDSTIGKESWLPRAKEYFGVN